MKKFLVKILFLITPGICAAQTKVYVNSLNEQCDSAKAASVLYFYSKSVTDTVYRMEQYGIDKKLLTSGGYEDNELRFVHGPFKYYGKISASENKLGNDKGQSQQGIFLQEEGKFIHGKKEGLWTNYFADGTVKRRQTFNNDILNGPYELFHQNGEIFSKGNYIYGVKEGMWLENGGLDELTYQKGKLIKSNKNHVLEAELEKKGKELKKYYVEAQPTTVFGQDLIKFLQEENTNNVNLEKVTVNLMIDEKGELRSVSVNGVSDFTLGDKIKAYFLKHKKWQPATTGIDKKPIGSRLTYHITLQ
jgi:antitoxin component YwqK of YwqJK toxin-antitoxin module